MVIVVVYRKITGRIYFFSNSAQGIVLGALVEYFGINLFFHIDHPAKVIVGEGLFCCPDIQRIVFFRYPKLRRRYRKYFSIAEILRNNPLWEHNIGSGNPCSALVIICFSSTNSQSHCIWFERLPHQVG